MSRARRQVLWLSLGLVLVSTGCRPEPPSNFDSNLAPETFVTKAPAESTRAYYRVHLYWGGMDPDGSVDYFEYAVTDSNKLPEDLVVIGSGYTRTEKTDSLFSFTTSDPYSPINRQVLEHRFYVRAVDEEGKVDPTPALIVFNAQNFNYPEVIFLSGVGTWTDGTTGELRSRPLTFNENIWLIPGRFAPNPTDTIGVGGSVRVSWTGRDRDDGGCVRGYLWKFSGETLSRGGTLVACDRGEVSPDTVASFTFPPDFSGKRSVIVEAIDDAGSKTDGDSLRTFVVNFDPVTWVVSPGGPEMAPGEGRHLSFVSGGITHESGDTLGNPSDPAGHNVAVFFTAMDTQDVGGFVTRYSYRFLNRGGGPDWANMIPTTDFHPYPARNSRNFISLTSSDWQILIRSTDNLGRHDGSPDTVLVYVNHKPRFTLLEPADGSTVPLSAANPLIVRYMAVDDLAGDEPGSRVTEYELVVDGISFGFEGITDPSQPVEKQIFNLSSGSHTIIVRARDNGVPVQREASTRSTFRIQ
jgi:hypothetical protein